MTAVPVVSATLTTRTVRECRTEGPWDEPWKTCTHGERHTLHGVEVRERLSVDPVFVVLPEAPDLTCRTCDGYGTVVYDDDEELCPSCGGTGGSPVYAATWQAINDDGNWYTPGRPLTKQDIERFPNDCRQVVEWRARRVEPLPVVGDSCPSSPHIWRYTNGATPGAVVAYSMGTNPSWTHLDLTDEPWAVDLQPGMCVLRLSDWEHLEQPHTAMECSMAGDYWHPRDCDCPGTLPLSVPDGVLSWIELA